MQAVVRYPDYHKILLSCQIESHTPLNNLYLMPTHDLVVKQQNCFDTYCIVYSLILAYFALFLLVFLARSFVVMIYLCLIMKKRLPYLYYSYLLNQAKLSLPKVARINNFREVSLFGQPFQLS